MARAHRVADIASQAQLSRATVDRVLHGRGASARAVRAVEEALADLDRQRTQLRLGARTLVIDVVIQAPDRFSGAMRTAVESELGTARPAALRVRSHLSERADVTGAVAAIDAVGAGRRISHGLFLKAPDHPRVAEAARRLSARGVPVVTLVTDIQRSGRVAYVGLDNRAAGATAAYLVSQWLGDRPGDVLVSLSRSTFFGEAERLQNFQEAMTAAAPGRRLVVVTDSDGLDAQLHHLVARTLAGAPEVVAAYSIGGGNRAILGAFREARRPCHVFVGHDLDQDNRELLAAGEISAVLHHDLALDARAAIAQILRHHRLRPGAPTSVSATPQVVTPVNLPHRWSG